MDATSKDTKQAIREQMAANARLLSVAHDADVNEAMDDVAWERRGLLGRLTRRAA